MHIIYDTETQEFFRFTKSPLQPGNVKIYSTFIAPVGKGIWITAVQKPFIVMQLMHVDMRSTEVTVTGTEAAAPQLRPSFIGGTGGLSVGLRTDLSFYPEADQRMFLVFNLEDGLAGLFTVSRKDDGILEYYRPGIPNTYSDGKLCVGNAPVPGTPRISELGIIPWLQEWLDAWASAPFNGDLRCPHHDRTLVFDPEAKNNVQLGNDWRDVYPGTTPDKELATALEGVINYANLVK